MATVVVFGGAGFLGRRLVSRLATQGMTVRVAVRHPDPARDELPATYFQATGHAMFGSPAIRSGPRTARQIVPTKYMHGTTYEYVRF